MKRICDLFSRTGFHIDAVADRGETGMQINVKTREVRVSRSVTIGNLLDSLESIEALPQHSPPVFSHLPKAPVLGPVD